MSRITGLVPNATGSQSVGTSAVVALAADPTRNFLLIQCNHATQSIGFTLDGSTPVIGNAGTTVLKGDTANAGGAVIFDTFVPTGPVTIIGSGAATPCTVLAA